MFIACLSCIFVILLNKFISYHIIQGSCLFHWFVSKLPQNCWWNSIRWWGRNRAPSIATALYFSNYWHPCWDFDARSAIRRFARRLSATERRWLSWTGRRSSWHNSTACCARRSSRFYSTETIFSPATCAPALQWLFNRLLVKSCLNYLLETIISPSKYATTLQWLFNRLLMYYCLIFSCLITKKKRSHASIDRGDYSREHC